MLFVAFASRPSMIALTDKVGGRRVLRLATFAQNHERQRSPTTQEHDDAHDDDLRDVTHNQSQSQAACWNALIASATLGWLAGSG